MFESLTDAFCVPSRHERCYGSLACASGRSVHAAAALLCDFRESLLFSRHNNHEWQLFSERREARKQHKLQERRGGWFIVSVVVKNQRICIRDSLLRKVFRTERIHTLFVFFANYQSGGTVTTLNRKNSKEWRIWKTRRIPTLFRKGKRLKRYRRVFRHPRTMVRLKNYKVLCTFSNYFHSFVP